MSGNRCDMLKCNGGRAWQTDESVEYNPDLMFCSGECADKYVGKICAYSDCTGEGIWMHEDIVFNHHHALKYCNNYCLEKHFRILKGEQVSESYSSSDDDSEDRP